jgi:ATP-dependent Clp protease ATP-binding subunit ClpB
MAPESARLFEQAEQIAQKAGDAFVTVERLLLGLALAKGTGAARALGAEGVTANGRALRATTVTVSVCFF